jgi:uncharacterized protein YoxC
MRIRRRDDAATDREAVASAAALRTLMSSCDDLGLAAADLGESIGRVEGSTVQSAAAAAQAAEATARVGAGASAVAGAASQISSAMHEVAASAAQATTVTSEAAEVTTQVRAAVERLTTSTSEIGGVVRTVSGISDQTRMLALNATIEAARAGAAGRGFAVVAEEVKNLAALTSEATAQIGNQLAALAADSDGVRRATERIDEVLRRIDELQQTIAAAVEEQTAAIAEITRSAAETAGAAEELDGSVSTSAAAALAARSAVERSKEWLEKVSSVLARQHDEMTGLGVAAEVHPLRAAITAHAGWKRNLLQAIDTGRAWGGVTVASAGRSDGCDFGRWLVRRDGEAADASMAGPAAEKHAAFHREAARVLDAALRGRTDEARTLMADERGYAGAATALTDHLTGWLARVE